MRTLFTLYASLNCGEVLCTGGKGTGVPAATPLAGREVEGKGGEGRKVGVGEAWGHPSEHGCGSQTDQGWYSGCSRVNPGRRLYLFDPEVAHL